MVEVLIKIQMVFEMKRYCKKNIQIKQPFQFTISDCHFYQSRIKTDCRYFQFTNELAEPNYTLPC